MDLSEMMNKHDSGEDGGEDGGEEEAVNKKGKGSPQRRG